MTKCTKCGARMRAAKVEHRLEVSGIELAGELKGQVCGECGEESIELTELARFELGTAAALAGVGVCTGEAFKFIRKALGMRAADVGEVLGVAAETVSRWENGQRDMDPHAFALLGEIAIAQAEGRPSPAERFKSLASTDRKLPKSISVKLAS